MARANFDADLCRHMASLGHGKFKLKSYKLYFLSDCMCPRVTLMIGHWAGFASRHTTDSKLVFNFLAVFVHAVATCIYVCTLRYGVSNMPGRNTI